MSLQERSAWIMLIALLFSGVIYMFTLLSLTDELGSLPSPSSPTLLGFTFITIAIAIIGHAIIAMMNPKDTNAPTDERGRLISQKAGSISSYILAAGIVCSLSLFLLIQNGSMLFYACFASLIISQISDYILQIYFNRRRFY
ncbi:hypothetical protein J8L70_10950 [Pseudoalteromonas sp. MMG010]|uniref:hypothetical protein n=1 Tax=Pseudoalteromonas sp. MMG010 TaxID=2822685 RepID=UPI001B39D7A1|nr:hypothetical protein [Pseudoalteromonas sp. MMG010]MBQ4833761.1 hypothetical protein [Pseudoalteromonas sp. MMG010]